MKQFKFVLLILIIGVFIVFAIQNINTVKISLFNWSVSLPLAFTVAGIYVLGMFTGGLLWSSLKKLAGKEEH